jgi:dolichol-phosphate mannosyltransferase
MGGTLQVLICVPTYNEAENIEPFLRAVFDAAPANSHVLVVDDNSPDGTAAIVEKLMEQFHGRLFIIKRPGKLGNATAYFTAYEWGMGNGYDAMLAMDADFSHDCKYIPAIVAEGEKGADVVIGSRFVEGGVIDDRSWIRNLISLGGSWYCRLILNRSIKDWTAGYNLWTRNALQKINIASIVTRGYSYQIELKYKALLQKCRVVETPIIFHDRKKGETKMYKSFFFEALVDVWRIKLLCIDAPVLKHLFKYGITGGLGTITNLALFFLCADIFNLPPVPVSIGCFIASGTQCYLLHHKWTFAQNMRGIKVSFKRWFMSLSAGLVGLTVNITVLSVILKYFNPPYKIIAQIAGIAAGVLFNFTISHLLVFRKPK